MKTNKLLAAGALALSMAMSPVASVFTAMPLTVLADQNTTHTITIENATDGARYTAYQIFTGTTLESGTGKNLADIKWGNGITDEGKTAAYTKYELQGDNQTAANVAKKLVEDTDARAFATLINDYLQNGTDSTVAPDGTVKINVTGDGYYLIKDKNPEEAANPTESILKVVNDVTVNPKTTDVPTHEKKVQENVKNVSDRPTLIEGDKMNDVADYNIGDSIPFELAAQAPAADKIESYTEYKFVFHDKMDAGLTLEEGSIRVFADDTEITTEVTTITSTTDGDTFDVEVKIKGKNVDHAGKKLRVTFNATLNKNAKLDEGGNENQFKLEYSNNPTTNGTGTTLPDEVVVFTYHMDLTKVDKDNTDTKLKGAQFMLYKGTGDNKEYLKAEKTEDNTAWVVTGWTKVEEEGTTLTSTGDNGAKFTIKGLDDGTYYLKETKAPAGYNTPTEDFKLVLTATTVNNQGYLGNPADAIGDIKLNETKGTSANIENTKGHSLPETGGMGTTMIYGAGALMAVGAAVVYVTNKRTRKN